MELIENLKWRYATKKFDSSKKVSDEEISKLQEAIQLSASSYGLQLYKVLIITDQTIKDKLRVASYDQSQVSDASHIFVLCNYVGVDPTHVDELLELKANANGMEISDLAGSGDFMKNTIKNLSEDQVKTWTTKQTYIALANLLSAAAELKIDSCPMEGFDAAAYNKILGLNERNLNAALVAPVGYRDETDSTQYQSKVRRPIEHLFEYV